MCFSVVSAQTSRYNVNIYTDPLPMVEYTPPMGKTYQNYLQMLLQTHREVEEQAKRDFERQQLKDELQQLQESQWLESQFRQIEDGWKIVSEEVQIFNGTNLATKALTPIRVRVVKRNRGSVDLHCLGIKKGEIWDPCTKDIVSLQEMYQLSTSNDEKRMILGLMDYGNYLLDTNEEIYIIK